jgi:predicted PurR-regulated permease PerM
MMTSSFRCATAATRTCGLSAELCADPRHCFGVVIFLLAGLLIIDPLWQALLPAGLYLGLHLIEGETATPMLLARRFTLNPVLVIISLVFWFWMWGVPGAILAVPMLAITKIICDRVRPLTAFGHFLEG